MIDGADYRLSVARWLPAPSCWPNGSSSHSLPYSHRRRADGCRHTAARSCKPTPSVLTFPFARSSLRRGLSTCCHLLAIAEVAIGRDAECFAEGLDEGADAAVAKVECYRG